MAGLDLPERGNMQDNIRDTLIDFGLPALLIVVCTILILTGKDGEVKSILAMAAGWIFKSGVQKRKR